MVQIRVWTNLLLIVTLVKQTVDLFLFFYYEKFQVYGNNERIYAVEPI